MIIYRHKMFRNQQLSNLEVSNLQEISRRLHMADEKQFGKYDGGILADPSIVNTCTEQKLYGIWNDLEET